MNFCVIALFVTYEVWTLRIQAEPRWTLTKGFDFPGTGSDACRFRSRVGIDFRADENGRAFFEYRYRYVLWSVRSETFEDFGGSRRFPIKGQIRDWLP